MEPAPLDKGTLLALDFGLKRIGMAVGDLERGIAHPLHAIAYEDNARRMQAIAELVMEWHPVRLIVGIPGSADGDPHPLAPHIARFVRRLRARFGIPVETIEERLSSWSASRKLSAAGLPAHRQSKHLDAMAACVILETWLEQHRPGATLPSPGLDANAGLSRDGKI